MAYTDKQKARACYYAAAGIVVVLLLIVLYMWHEHAVKNTGEKMYVRKNRVYDNPGNPTRYEYGNYLMGRAAQGGPAHGRRAHDGHRGHDHGAGGVSHVDFDHNHGYHMNDGLGERFSSREGMSVGAHWDTDGTYGHTAATLPSFGLSGYYEDTPTASWS
jgi:hypothetical protein